MKQFIFIMTMTLFSLQANAIALYCGDNQFHSYDSVIIADETGECPTGLKFVAGRDNTLCAESPIRELAPGQYQVCGFNDTARNVIVILQAVDWALR